MYEDVITDIEKLFDKYEVPRNNNLIAMLAYYTCEKCMDEKSKLVDEFIKRLEGTYK